MKHRRVEGIARLSRSRGLALAATTSIPPDGRRRTGTIGAAVSGGPASSARSIARLASA